MARKPKTRAPYLMVSPATWELARAGYLGGETLKQVAARLQIGEHNLRRKINASGWTKRALADARARIHADGAIGAPPPAPTPPQQKDAPPAQAGDGADLLETVLVRAKAALTAGKGSEATALLKATREYVIARQDIADARAAIAANVKIWDRAQPARAGELTELLMVQALHPRWAGLSLEEEVDRVDPDGSAGLREWMKAQLSPDSPPTPDGRRR